ncbi:potassium transporter KefA [Clostridia bacterium]|nr:potassium transporter KefA [Clostridia bacterium]
MNYSIIRYILCRVLAFEGTFLLVPAFVALCYGEADGFIYLGLAIVCFAIGGVGRKTKPKKTNFFAKEGFVSVSLSWIILSLVGALPFFFTGAIPNYLDALFESVSGFSTTGATVLTDVEVLSRCNLFWRSFTHWMGGMGVLVLMAAILPLAGSHNIHLMKAESAGPSVGKLVPKVGQTARILYGIYTGMTVFLILLLLLSGMHIFDAVAIGVGTAGTGGFGLLNSSAASYSVASQIIMTIFMLLFGINFNVYFKFFAGKTKEALFHEEMRYFLIIVLAAIGLITWNTWGYFDDFVTTIQQVSFQVASIITTAGYSTTDYGLWPSFSQGILFVLMLIGACAGSTSGGIKVSRIIIMLKMIKNEVSYLIHPERVRQIRMERHILPKEVWRGVQVFLLAYLAIYLLSFLIISLDGFDFTTNFSAVAACLNNVGPGLGKVGPSGNFSIYGSLSKCVLIFDMLAGRLEIFPILVLLAPYTWKKGR